jgi:hypothetical protein
VVFVVRIYRWAVALKFSRLMDETAGNTGGSYIPMVSVDLKPADLSPHPQHRHVDISSLLNVWCTTMQHVAVVTRLATRLPICNAARPKRARFLFDDLASVWPLRPAHLPANPSSASSRTLIGW